MKTKKSAIRKPWTLEELGIPSKIQVAGKTITVKMNKTIMKVTPINSKGLWPFKMEGGGGVSNLSLGIIHLFPGNRFYVPIKEEIQGIFLHELLHITLRIHGAKTEDLKPGRLGTNESFVSGFSELWYQVHKQLKNYTKHI